MKKVLLMSLFAANSYAATTNFYIHNWADTNSPTVVTQIVMSLATNVSLQNSAPQTNIAVVGVTNAGTATYSNANAFLLSSRTNWAVADITNSGSASYSNASAFFLANGTLPIANVSSPGFIITNRNVNGFTNESLVVFTNNLIVGTNGNIHHTNIFQVATVNQRKALEVNTNGDVFIPNGQTNGGNIQSATLNTTGNATVAGTFLVSSGNLSVSSGGTPFLKLVNKGTLYAVVDGAWQFRNSADSAYGSILASGATVTGTITATNGFISYRSNLVAPTSITAPLTTVNWTNPIAVNIQVYIDNSGVTGTSIKKNNSQIFSSLVGDVTIGLQPGEYITLVYTIGTPSITYSPF